MQRRLASLLSIPVAVAVAASAACAPCFAWGDDGHKIVATIGTAMLTEDAQKALRDLLGDETVADAAVWADKMRSDPQYDWIAPLHYINVPRNATSLDMARDGNGGVQVVSSIIKYRDILKDTSRSKDERRLALRLLIHFVGDLHQPFHVSYKEDLGGNKLTVQSFGKKSNMHKVWDSELIRRRLNDTKGGWATMSADLRQSITPEQLKKWTASTDPAVWANEAFSITRLLYRDAPDARTGVDDAYFQRWQPTLNECLKVGGVRLGTLLNDALAPGSAKAAKPAKDVNAAKDVKTAKDVKAAKDANSSKPAKDAKDSAPATPQAAPKQSGAPE